MTPPDPPFEDSTLYTDADGNLWRPILETASSRLAHSEWAQRTTVAVTLQCVDGDPFGKRVRHIVGNPAFWMLASATADEGENTPEEWAHYFH